MKINTKNNNKKNKLNTSVSLDNRKTTGLSTILLLCSKESFFGFKKKKVKIHTQRSNHSHSFSYKTNQCYFHVSISSFIFYHYWVKNWV